MKIDSHQHFWQFDPARDQWITDEMSMIRRNFLPSDLAPILRRHGFDGAVTVQSDQTEYENEFQLANAANNDFIKGIIGWVDLQSPGVEERLQYWKGFSKMKGFRHILQGEADRALMLKPAFKQGIGLLNKYGFTYDILVFPDQLTFSAELVRSFPDQKFVLDHIAKPYIRKGLMDPWKKDILALSELKNCFCKISGIITEADWKNPANELLFPYLDVVFDAFGADRLLFGSDWPVCEVAGGYDRALGLIETYTAGFSANEKENIWGANATLFYNLY
jgi:L-fuconolactonase